MKKRLILLSALVAAVLLVNSCKKDSQHYINTLLTAQAWQLASVTVYTYQGASLTETDILSPTCDTTQSFKFNTDQTCSYQKFICKNNTTTGHWLLTPDQLTINCDMICKDTLRGGVDTTDAPFKVAKIINLGSYSLVLQTGDINTHYDATTVRTIKQYGFIHQSILQ